jgi:hypothetical protein
MAELKTKRNEQSVTDFINRVPDEQKRKDSLVILELMQRVTQEEPKMWGDSIVGFGSYHYKYASGHEDDAPLTGFSPRKQNLTLYIMPGFERYPKLMQSLGKHSTGKSCLYIKKLAEINLAVLEELVRQSVEVMKTSSWQ